MWQWRAKGWKGETLVLGRVLSCASPGWDVVPDMETNFAVEATVKLNVWPQPDWRGRVPGWRIGVGMFPLILTVLSGDNSSTPYSDPC